MRWIKKLICLLRQHDYILKVVNDGHYDRELYLQCTRCGKERDV